MTWQVEPLQVTRDRQEFLPEQVTTLAFAFVVMPPAHERVPLQVRLHSSPEQLTVEPQLDSPLQPSCVWEALLATGPLQALLPAQEMVHWVPPHLMGPAQESAVLFWPQAISHEMACEQSTPSAQPETPQRTSQACCDGQVMAALQTPCVVQSKMHLPV